MYRRALPPSPLTARPITAVDAVLDAPFARRLIGFALVLGMLWSVLPPGLQFVSDTESTAAPGEGTGTFALQWMPLILLSLVVIVARFSWFTLVLSYLNPWFLLLLGWAFLSQLWAPDGMRAMKQTIGISGVNLLAVAFVLTAWQPERFKRVLLPTVMVLLGLSLLAGLLVPSIGIHSSTQFELAGSWRGITYQKNGLGQLGTFGAILCLNTWCSQRGASPWYLGGVALSFLMILLSRSSTALLVALTVSGIIVMYLRPPVRLGAHGGWVKSLLWLIVLAPLFVYLVLIGSFDSNALAQAFGEIFGKDATFSGRTYIWAELIRSIADHPILGIGFNNFWNSPQSVDAVSRLGWPCPNGHNGYLDLLNELGLVGMALFVLLVVRHYRDVSRLSAIDYPQAVLHGSIVTYVMLANLTESGWFAPGAFTHIIAGYSSVTVSRLLFEADKQRLQHHAAFKS